MKISKNGQEIYAKIARLGRQEQEIGNAGDSASKQSLNTGIREEMLALALQLREPSPSDRRFKLTVFYGQGRDWTRRLSMTRADNHSTDAMLKRLAGNLPPLRPTHPEGDAMTEDWERERHTHPYVLDETTRTFKELHWAAVAYLDSTDDERRAIARHIPEHDREELLADWRLEYIASLETSSPLPEAGA